MAREIRAPRGQERSCKGWPQEAALRMLMNNLDPEVAEKPEELVVYGGTGRAARSWDDFDVIVRELRALEQRDLLSSEWEPSKNGPARRVYVMTDAGREARAEAIESLRQARDHLTDALNATEADETASG